MERGERISWLFHDLFQESNTLFLNIWWYIKSSMSQLKNILGISKFPPRIFTPLKHLMLWYWCRGDDKMWTMKKMINILSQDNVEELCIPPGSFLLKEYSIIQDSIKSFLLVFYKGNGNKVHIKLVENFDCIFFWKSLQIILINIIAML